MNLTAGTSEGPSTDQGAKTIVDRGKPFVRQLVDRTEQLTLERSQHPNKDTTNGYRVYQPYRMEKNENDIQLQKMGYLEGRERWSHSCEKRP